LAAGLASNALKQIPPLRYAMTTKGALYVLALPATIYWAGEHGGLVRIGGVCCGAAVWQLFERLYFSIAGA
jgi:hypothetical protein